MLWMGTSRGPKYCTPDRVIYHYLVLVICHAAWAHDLKLN
jgi:hypothetical protein